MKTNMFENIFKALSGNKEVVNNSNTHYLNYLSRTDLSSFTNKFSKFHESNKNSVDKLTNLDKVTV